ncbi:MAG TPA: family 78 glycoside hydrolase catalytic domain [Acidimicrobiia bacterium]
MRGLGTRRQIIGAGTVALALVVASSGLAACTSSGGGTSSAAPKTLTVDDLTAPIGLGTNDVFFAWQLGGSTARQSSYRLVVREQPRPGTGGHAATVWDSGKVQSEQQAFVPYGGRALDPNRVYTWTAETWNPSGQHNTSTAAHFETGLRDSDWRAHWIRRAADTATRPDLYTYARKEVKLGASPIVRARAFVAADQQYELAINGRRAGKGQAYSYPDAQYYETLDVTHLLRAGAPNAIAATTTWDGATKGHPAGEPGLIVQIDVDHADGSSEQIVTDGTWKVRSGAWLPGTQRDLEGDLVDYTERIDGPAIPVGWEEPGFDDRSWAGATDIGPAGTPPYTHLVPVRTRIVEQPVTPVSLRTLPNGSVVADFGKVYSAIPTVTFHHGTAGHVVPMHAGYLLDPNGSVSTTHGTQHTDMSYSYTERGGGPEQFHPFDYLGFRYFQIDQPGEKLTKDDVVTLARHTFVPDQRAATFSSSNSTIDAEFDLGRHSALYSAQEGYLDTPTREKGPWLWDGFNESTTAMDAFSEQNLTRKSLVEYAQSQDRYWKSVGAVNKIYPTGLGALDINEFTEIYPEWVWQYWLHNGDRSLLQAVYPAVHGVAQYVEHSVAPSTGLVTNLPSTSIYYTFPTVTRLNVLGVNVFRRAADIATILHRPASEVAQLRGWQQALTTATNTKLTRPDGTYVDGLEAGGSQVAAASQDTNASAVVYGVAPSAHVAAVAKYVAGLGMQAPPRTAAEVIEALALAGRDADLVHILTDADIDGWANILKRGATYTWEVWQPSDIIGDSMSHGWGANVLVEIQQALLGVRPTSPGYATFTVDPPTAGLARATGTVPTPYGSIKVQWQRSHGKLTIHVTVPPGTTGKVIRRTGSTTTVGPGSHTLTLSS